MFPPQPQDVRGIVRDVHGVGTIRRTNLCRRAVQIDQEINDAVGVPSVASHVIHVHPCPSIRCCDDASSINQQSISDVDSCFGEIQLSCSIMSGHTLCVNGPKHMVIVSSGGVGDRGHGGAKEHHCIVLPCEPCGHASRDHMRGRHHFDGVVDWVQRWSEPVRWNAVPKSKADVIACKDHGVIRDGRFQGSIMFDESPISKPPCQVCFHVLRAPRPRWLGSAAHRTPRGGSRPMGAMQDGRTVAAGEGGSCSPAMPRHTRPASHGRW